MTDLVYVFVTYVRPFMDNLLSSHFCLTEATLFFISSQLLFIWKFGPRQTHSKLTGPFVEQPTMLLNFRDQYRQVPSCRLINVFWLIIARVTSSYCLNLHLVFNITYVTPSAYTNTDLTQPDSHANNRCCNDSRVNTCKSDKKGLKAA